MKNHSKFLLMFIFLVCLISIISVSSFAQQDKTIIKLALVQPPEQAEGKFALKFKEIVEDRTNGSADVQIYFRSELGGQKDYIEGLRMGTLELTWVTIGFFSSYDPFLNIFELPYLFNSREHAFWMVNGPLKQIIQERVEKHGVKLLTFFEVGTRHITNSKRPINTPEDLEGLKIRVPQAQVNIDSLNALGANASPLSGSELYLALSQGLFDGQENPSGQVYFNKWYEVQKYLSKTGHMFLMHMVLYSEQLWNQLSPEMQNIVESAAKEAAVYQIVAAVEEEKIAERALVEEGMEINEVDTSAFREKTKPLYKEYIEEYGPEAENVINIIKMTQFE